jgi:signal transduction histidine kinase
MAKPVWYRSLYWRIGLGFVLFLALVLAAQAGTLLWLISRMDVGPGPASPSVTRLLAGELSQALTENSKLDIQRFFREHYEERLPIVAVMRDGRVVSSNGKPPPDELLVDARSRLAGPPDFFYPRPPPPGDDQRMGGPRSPDDRAPGDQPEFRSERRRGPGAGRGFGPGPPYFARFGGPMRRSASPVVVNDQLAGVVIANPLTTWQQLGPTLVTVGLILVGIGTTCAAFLIFAPVRGRLQSLEEAARQVGSGDLTARAREDGRDEVAAVAATFNQMTKDLASRAEELQAADRSRRMLFADVSHELMTPLTAMRGYIETLSMTSFTIDAETRARYLSIINDETTRLEHIVRDLLDMARLEASRESIDKQDVPLEDLFGRVQARHEREAQLKSVEISSSIAPGAEIVAGDPLRLEQALQNLAANALRHTPAGGRIELLAQPHGRDIMISVKDNGSGIASEHLPHVFDRFYKVDPSRDVSSSAGAGSGLGLSIVKTIVERHGGSISVSSAPVNGTEFTILLPLS